MALSDVFHRPRRRVSARPFCLIVVVLMGMSGCRLLPPPGVSRLAVEVVENGPPVQGENGLQLRVFSSRAGTRSLVAYLEWTAPSGARLRTEHRLRVPGGTYSRFDLVYQVREVGIHRMALRLYDLQRGERVWEQEEWRRVVLPRWEFTRDRSYYTGEDEIRFLARLNRTDESGMRVRVELGLPDRTGPLAAADLAFHGRQVEGAFPAAALPAGQYELRARLYSGSGVEDSLGAVFAKHPPAAHEVKIDLFGQGLLVDGAPFFPVGLYWLRVDVLGEMRRLGFNCGDYYYRLGEEEIAALMDEAGREGVRILLELSDFIRGHALPDQAAIEATVERYREHPALLAWYIVDEPADAGVRPEDVRRIYRRIRELDPYHPVYLVNNRPRTYADYSDGSDILAVDVYPVPRYPLTRVGEYVEQARWCAPGRRPVWLVAQAFGGVEHWPRPPTAVELRNMVYQGLVRGARGVLFYRHVRDEERQIQPLALWREVRDLAAELNQLGPVLMAPDPGEELSGGPGVDLMLKRHEDAYYLFAVNLTPSPRRLRLPLDELAPVTGGEVLYHGRQPRLQNGMFEADIEPLGVGVYRLEVAGI